MSSDRITGRDVILMIGGAVAGAVIPGILGWYTGSFGVVLSFASANPLESLLWTLLFLSLGALAGLLARGRSAKKELEAKDRELSRLRKNNRAHNALFKEFCELKHDEQLQIVSVWLSEPEGFEPSKEQRAHMGDWVKMKDFLRHAVVTDRLHIVDGVGEMLLENPRHVYDLMAARVADLEQRTEAGDSAGTRAANDKELKMLQTENARLRSESTAKDRRIASLERRIADSEVKQGGEGTRFTPSDEERYALLGTAGLADLLWAYDHIDKNGSIPSSSLGPKMDSVRVQRLLSKGVLRKDGNLLSGGASYDMEKDWRLFVHRKRQEIKGRLRELDKTSRTSMSGGTTAAVDLSTITPAEAKFLLNFFNTGSVCHPMSDGRIRSLIGKGVIHVIGSDTKEPGPGDSLGIDESWTRFLNDHRDEFMKHFDL